VNPWVERTQSLLYLVGMERADLMACIEEPVAELGARSEKAAICVAIRGSMQFS
jgi:hypothetical protein